MEIKYIRRSLFKWIKQNKFLFCLYGSIVDYQEKNKEQKSFSGTRILKSKDRIKTEKKIYRDYWHCGNFPYDRYGLAYKTVTKEQLLDYVPNFYHHKKLERDHDGIDTVKFSEKLVQCQLFEERKIPTAETIAFIKYRKWFDFDNRNEVNISQTILDYLSKPSNKLYIKPTGGQGGNGILVLKSIDGILYLNNCQINSFDDVVKNTSPKETYIVQKKVFQSKQISEIYPNCVNTLRVIVQRQDDRMIMKTCSMRIGQGNSEIDNSCQGGICIKVDIISGKLDVMAKGRYDGYVYEEHPDTNTRFADISINNWSELKAEIETIATKLIDFKNIALDIAVTDEGAKLLEFNFRYGIEHQQCVLGGVRKLLGIYPDC